MSFWIKIGVALALLVAVGFLKGRYDASIFQQGYSKAKGEADAREAAIKIDTEKKLAAATLEAKAREKALLEEVSRLNTVRHKEERNYETELAKYRAAARAGDERLRITVRNCQVFGASEGGATAIVTGLGGEARADVVPGVADTILGVAGGIAKSVRDYNALLAQYYAIRRTCETQ